MLGVCLWRGSGAVVSGHGMASTVEHHVGSLGSEVNATEVKVPINAVSRTHVSGAVRALRALLIWSWLLTLTLKATAGVTGGQLPAGSGGGR